MSTAGQPRRADAVRNRRLALDAAKTLLVVPGATVTVEAIAQQAGLGAATVVRAFGTKDALIDAAVSDLLEPLVTRGAQAMAGADSAVALRAFLLDLIEFQAAHWIVSERLTRLQVPLTSARRAELGEILRGLLRRAREAGAIRSDIAPDTIAVMLGETAYAVARAKGPSSELADGFVAIITDGLRPPSGG